ncbi:MAG: TldD/PmbA family protein [Methylocystaceae bacterium]
MEERLKKAGQVAIDLATREKIEAEAFVLHDRQLSIEVVNGEVETLSESEQIGIGVRVIDQDKTGFAYTTDLSPQAVEDALHKAKQSAGYTTADQYLRLVEPGGSYPQMDLVDPAITEMTLEAKIALAIDVEKAARAYDKRITVVERTGYDDSIFEMAIMNTRGVNAYSRGAYCALYAMLVAEENGAPETGFALRTRREPKGLNPAEVGEEAAANAVRMLGAKSIGSKKMPVIFEPYVATNFISLIASAVSADAVQKGKSFFAGKLGQQVASPVLTVVDDQLRSEAVGSFPFDGEGTPAQRTVVLEKGWLKSYLYDAYTAAKDNCQSTGNGRRGSFRSLPGVGTSNFIIQPGEKSKEELIAEIDDGLMVTEVMGMHTANPISGDYSLGITGIRIEKGKLTYPVRGITMAGNLVDLLKDIEAVGSDLTFYGSDASPSIRLKAVSLGGE